MIVVTYYRVSDADIGALTAEDIGEETIGTIVDDMALDNPPNVMYHFPDSAEDILVNMLVDLESKNYLKLPRRLIK